MLNLGIRYIHRDISTVLEDYAPASPVMYDLGFPRPRRASSTLIDNITADLVTLIRLGVPGFEDVPRPFFEDPVHKYDSVEVTATKAYSDNWSLFASYRWSRLKGNFEGFFRSDNGQSDPAITSLFDFPTNDPSYTEIGVPAVRLRGRHPLPGHDPGRGPPAERPDAPVQALRQLHHRRPEPRPRRQLRLGPHPDRASPPTRSTTTPARSRSTLRGEGVETQDGFLESTKFETVINVHASYNIRFGSRQPAPDADRGRLQPVQQPGPALVRRLRRVRRSATPNPNYGYADQRRQLLRSRVRPAGPAPPGRPASSGRRLTDAPGPRDRCGRGGGATRPLFSCVGWLTRARRGTNVHVPEQPRRLKGET